MNKKDPKKILLSKSLRFTPEEIQGMTIFEAWNAVYEEANLSKKTKEINPTICFTGFTAPEKVTLTARANIIGLKSVGSVSNSLKYLCIGPNAGPSKIEKARNQKTIILSEKDFYALNPNI